MSTELTPTTRAKVDAVIEMVLGEIERLGGSYQEKTSA
jgi:hypothetical protein